MYRYLTGLALCALMVSMPGAPGLEGIMAAVKGSTTGGGQVPAPVRSAATRGVSLVTMPYVGERNVAELSPGPEALASGGLVETLERDGARVTSTPAVKLSKEEERQYGAWQRLALANGHLAELVADGVRRGDLSVGLLANCASLMGMLGGVQHSGPGDKPLRVGLVYLDAHGDFNTPETTLSGMLGGMDVAISAGLCLTRLRTTSKLDPPVPPGDIVLAGVRDTDPLEEELIQQHRVPRLSVEELRERGARFRETLRALAARVDRIYVHVDMDVLDPSEVPGHPLGVRNGPTAPQLAQAVAEIFANPKAVALGIASTPTGERDKDGRSKDAAYELIRAAVRGAV
jgi:arginase